MNQQNMETRFPNLEVSPKHAGYLFMLFTCHRHHDSKCPLETIAHQLVWWSICGWYWASSDAVSPAKNSMGWINLWTISIPRLVIVTQCLQCLPGVNQFNLFLLISFITSWNMREKLLTCLFPLPMLCPSVIWQEKHLGPWAVLIWYRTVGWSSDSSPICCQCSDVSMLQLGRSMLEWHQRAPGCKENRLESMVWTCFSNTYIRIFLNFSSKLK